MKKIVLAASLVVALGGLACSPSATTARPAETTSAQSSPLEGKKYVAHAVLPDGTAVTSELSFVAGMFDSSACEKLGFHAGRYSVTQSGDVITFRAKLETSDGRSEVWTGRIEGNVITGDCLGADGTRVSFQGRLA
ncbi:MAG TPA: hypothetical protein VIF62_31440 [Labilithrix sp.]|jgi:hypothetical protein